MARVLFANNVSTMITADITETSTVIPVTSSDGFLVSDPTTNDVAFATLEQALDASGIEVVRILAKTATSITVARNIFSTTSAPQFFTAGSAIEMRLTKSIMDNVLQTEDIFVGDQPPTSSRVNQRWISTVDNIERFLFSNAPNTPTWVEQGGPKVGGFPSPVAGPTAYDLDQDTAIAAVAATAAGAQSDAVAAFAAAGQAQSDATQAVAAATQALADAAVALSAANTADSTATQAIADAAVALSAANAAQTDSTQALTDAAAALAAANTAQGEATQAIADAAAAYQPVDARPLEITYNGPLPALKLPSDSYIQFEDIGEVNADNIIFFVPDLSFRSATRLLLDGRVRIEQPFATLDNFSAATLGSVFANAVPEYENYFSNDTDNWLSQQTTEAVINNGRDVWEPYGTGLEYTPQLNDPLSSDEEDFIFQRNYYNVSLSLIWSANVNNRSNFFRVVVTEDGANPTTILEVSREAKEVGGTGITANVVQGGVIVGNSDTGTNIKDPICINADFPLLAGVEYKWQIEYKCDTTPQSPDPELCILSAFMCVQQRIKV